MFDKNFLIDTAYTLKEILNFRVAPIIIGKLYNSRIIDFTNKIYNIFEAESLEDLELLTDFYIGTIFNNLYTETEILHGNFTIALPEEFFPYSIEFNKVHPILKWKNCFFNASVNRFNFMDINCIGEITPEKESPIFNLTREE